jgi:hypothetical protein
MATSSSLVLIDELGVSLELDEATEFCPSSHPRSSTASYKHT